MKLTPLMKFTEMRGEAKMFEKRSISLRATFRKRCPILYGDGGFRNEMRLDRTAIC